MDHGQVETEKLGWLAWLAGRRARRLIVREADIEAAMRSLPIGATVTRVDPTGNFLVYAMPNSDERIRFWAKEAWLPNEPTLGENRTEATKASVLNDCQVLVLEGLHRTRAMARGGVMIAPNKGGVDQAPGWLDFVFDPEGTILSDSSLERSGPWDPIPAK